MRRQVRRRRRSRSASGSRSRQRSSSRSRGRSTRRRSRPRSASTRRRLVPSSPTRASTAGPSATSLSRQSHSCKTPRTALWSRASVIPDGVPLDTISLAVRTTKAPAVVRFRPRAAALDVARDAAISVRFTQAMDRRSTARAFTVSVDGGRGRRQGALGGTRTRSSSSRPKRRCRPGRPSRWTSPGATEHQPGSSWRPPATARSRRSRRRHDPDAEAVADDGQGRGSSAVGRWCAPSVAAAGARSRPTTWA